MRKLTHNDFVERAGKIHGYKYDYSQVNYINTYTRIKIICPIHGEFEQTPDCHLRGYGCSKCGLAIMGRPTLTTEKFIRRAKEIHGNKYDYSQVNYINVRTKVKIICKKYGIFEQSPFSHLRNHGCPKCGQSLKGFHKFKNQIITILKEEIMPSNTPLTNPDLIKDTNWVSICYGNGQFVAVGHNGTIVTSPDGINWTVRQLAEAIINTDNEEVQSGKKLTLLTTLLKGVIIKELADWCRTVSAGAIILGILNPTILGVPELAFKAVYVMSLPCLVACLVFRIIAVKTELRK
jgi:hypothetical protein